MSKEEYAELWYLLGKIKYAIAEDIIKISSSEVRAEQQKILDSIDAITKICIIDKDDKKNTMNV